MTKAPADYAFCRICKCTEALACLDEVTTALFRKDFGKEPWWAQSGYARYGVGCHWVELPEPSRPGLCSVCARLAAPSAVAVMEIAPCA